MKKKNKIKPLPAVASEDGPFNIEEIKHFWQQSLKTKDKIGKFRAPLEDGDMELALRIHQYGRLHLKSQKIITEKLLSHQSETADNSWVQVALDAITDAYLLSQGCDEIKKMPTLDPEVPENDVLSAAYKGIKYSNIDEKILDNKIFDEEERKVLKHAAQKFKEWGEKGEIPETEFLQTIKSLQNKFDYIHKRVVQNDLEYYTKDEKEASFEELMGMLAKQDADMESGEVDADIGELEKQLKKKLSEKNKRDSDPKNKWGKMSIEKLKFTEENQYLKKAKRMKPHYIGAFKYPQRALLPSGDGLAFGLRQKIKGGTILLDCSGSMHIGQEDIDSLLKVIPMATIACYQGKTNTTGELAIIVLKGKAAKSNEIGAWRDKMTSGNIVDGPALEWLSKQTEPRLWISDGQVTGINDMSATNLKVEAMLIKIKGKIKRMNSIAIYLKSLK